MRLTKSRFAPNCSASSASSSTPRALRRRSRSRRSRRPGGGWRRGCGDNGRVLLGTRIAAIAAAIREERAITPAAEWLVDNFHVVEEQIREIRDDLPRGFYRQLPKLADGPLEGYPRVFGIAWAFVAHTDSRFDPQMLRQVRAGLSARAAADDR